MVINKVVVVRTENTNTGDGINKVVVVRTENTNTGDGINKVLVVRTENKQLHPLKCFKKS